MCRGWVFQGRLSFAIRQIGLKWKNIYIKNKFAGQCYKEDRKLLALKYALKYANFQLPSTISLHRRESTIVPHPCLCILVSEEEEAKVWNGQRSVTEFFSSLSQAIRRENEEEKKSRRLGQGEPAAIVQSQRGKWSCPGQVCCRTCTVEPAYNGTV